MLQSSFFQELKLEQVSVIASENIWPRAGLLLAVDCFNYFTLSSRLTMFSMQAQARQILSIYRF